MCVRECVCIGSIVIVISVLCVASLFDFLQLILCFSKCRNYKLQPCAESAVMPQPTNRMKIVRTRCYYRLDHGFPTSSASAQFFCCRVVVSNWELLNDV